MVDALFLLVTASTASTRRHHVIASELALPTRLTGLQLAIAASDFGLATELMGYPKSTRKRCSRLSPDKQKFQHVN
jgi:hypothetical protein